MISTSKPKSNSHPWCIIRQLPNMQRMVVARFHRRHDADAYRQILQRLLPTAKHVIIFDPTISEIAEDFEKTLVQQMS
ncbi:hypothetical protein H6G74_24710 [Nostoc spongiaeforme FACHB-130]|uniref:Uncharacterized protein n=1 Tax=Nostoc spongiaeforme FACHB-130 TaxID=1357510 RepID=A0ABR8G2M3_9NOSO|nr:hypothetical protein [Nostoc spongiaeforme]MBD2597499.1 hypothetical protein [Nostoc spongiaeforme FACHB-130]